MIRVASLPGTQLHPGRAGRCGFVPALALMVAGCVVAAFTSLAGLAQEATPGVEFKKIVPKKKEAKKDESFRVVGTLKSTDPIDKIRPGSHFQVHPYKMEAGKNYVIDMKKVAKGTVRDPFLHLDDAAGVTLMQDDDGGGSLNSRIIFSPSVTDEYKIYATTLSAGDLGGYELTVSILPPGVPLPGRGMPTPVYLPAEFGDIVVTPEPYLVDPHSVVATDRGYFEYRFTIENNSETQPHRVTLSLPRHRNHYRGGFTLGPIHRTIDLPPMQQATVSLFQPFVPLSSGGGVSVIIDGQEQENGVNLTLAENRGRSGGGGWGGHMKMPGPGGGRGATILTTNDILASLNTAVFTHSRLKQDPKGAGMPGTVNVNLATTAVPMTSWSKSWLGYGVFPGIVLPAHAVASAPAEVRAALWQYVETGGSLLLVGKVSVPRAWERSRSTMNDWTRYNPGFGQCIVAGTDVNAYSFAQLEEIFAMWDSANKAFDQVSNINDAHRIFPVVDAAGVPVRGLFIFMFLFVLIIGPLNLFWLARIHRKIWLLWTVPLIAIVTSSLLFGYMALSEGWHGHVRIESITVLDEGAQRATSIGWLGVYSPMTPGDGLRFEQDTEISPHFDADHGHIYRGNVRKQGLSIDWTNQQHFATGWVTAKVPFYAIFRRNHPELKRLLVKKEGAELTAVNSLGANVATLWYADAEGKIWKAENMSAGAKASLTRDGDEVAKGTESALREGFGIHWLSLAKQMEEHPSRYLRSNCYLALINDLPFMSPGLEQTQSRKARSLVFGVLKESP